MKRVLVFLYEDKLSPRGGPNGVGYYLKKGFDEMKIEWIDFLKSPKDEKNSFYCQERSSYQLLINKNLKTY